MASLAWSWLAVALWLAVIALESSELMSAEHTRGWLYATFTAVFGSVDDRVLRVFNAVLRKCGHFVGYAILSLLLFRALRATLARAAAAARTVQAALELRCAALAVLLTFAVACLDEWHQTMLASRTGSLRDVLLDTAGAILTQGILLMACRRERVAAAE